MKPIILIGGGGHARVLLDAMLLMSKDVIGYTDLCDRGLLFEVAYLGTDEEVYSRDPNELYLVNGIGSIPPNDTRRRLFTAFANSGYRFASVIHVQSCVARNVQFGEGTQVMAGAVIQTGTTIGENCIINTRSSVDHDCSIGANVHIAPGVTLSGGVKVGDAVHIGTGANVLQSVRIGSNSIIGAGALVLHDVPENTTVVGVSRRGMR